MQFIDVLKARRMMLTKRVTGMILVAVERDRLDVIREEVDRIVDELVELNDKIERIESLTIVVRTREHP